jgi:GNAT superfamily N-acetyltransferase
VNDLLALVEQHAHAVAAHGTESVSVGPFTALLSDDPALSHAFPTEVVGQAELDGPLAALADVFAKRNQPLRLEFAALRWPNLASGLEGHGLALEAGAPLWILAPAAHRPHVDHTLTIRWVGERDDLGFLAALVRQGFGVPGGITVEDTAALAAGRAAGVRWAVAKREGIPTGSGCSTPIGPTTELSAISVLPNLRGRGAGAAILSFLVEQHFAAGGQCAWTSPADAAATTLLERAGFHDAGLRMTYVRP